MMAEKDKAEKAQAEETAFELENLAGETAMSGVEEISEGAEALQAADDIAALSAAELAEGASDLTRARGRDVWLQTVWQV